MRSARMKAGNGDTARRCGRARRRLAGPAVGCLLLVSGVLSGMLSGAFAQGPIFQDEAKNLGLDFVYFNGMSGEMYFSEMAGAGVALFDFDRDGDLDVYLTQGHMIGKGKTLADAVFPPQHPEPLVDRLYRNDLAIGADGSLDLRFVDVTDASGLQAGGYGMGVAAGDYDNDGWVDLYVTNAGPNEMYRNNGDGTFTEVTEAAGTQDARWTVSAGFFDYDEDGWLDLFAANYTDFRIVTHKNCASATGQFDYCGPLAYSPEPDRFFRNNGDGTFEDVTVTAGVHEEYGSGLGVVAADFNGDDRLDIYVANDQMPNQMWIGQPDGTFMNEALFAGAAVNEEGKAEASMGVVAGDFNGDGSEDLFMTHITRETNTMYMNDGTGLFEDTTRDSGLGMSSWKFTGFGTVLFDYDNDGWQDLYIANGAVKTIPELASANDPYPLSQTNQLFRNEGSGRFVEVTAEAGPALARAAVSRGVSVGDVDLDGDSDLVVGNNQSPTELLVNQVGQDKSWIGFRLTTGDQDRPALASRVAVTLPDGTIRWRRVSTDGSYGSSLAPEALVGLEATDSAVKARIRWHGGRTQEWHDLPLDRWLVFRERSAEGGV